jgi:hypothetical protein
MGKDSASSAQSKRAGSGETARFGSSWGEPGQMGGEQGVGGGRGVFTGEDGVLGDAGGVYHTGGGETARLQGVWGELGGWNAFGGRSGGSGVVLRRFRAVASGLEWGRAGVSAVVDDDVADLVDE